MAQARELTIGLIGCGGIMGWHIRNLQNVKGVTIGAMADPAPESLEKTKASFPHLAPASTYSDHRELLRSSRQDAVIICSRHSDHYPQVMDSLEAGCHVLVEKPFVESVARARAAIALAKKKNKVLMIAYQRHFDAKFRYMRKLVQEKRIGEVQQVASSLGQYWLAGTKGSWRQDPRYSCGGQLNDSGSHVVDIPLWITGLKPVEVFAHLNNCGAKVDINSAVAVKMENGAMWTINVGGNTPGFWEYLVIAGDKGALFYENGELTIAESGGRFKAESCGKYHDQTTGFIKAIRGETPNEVPGEFGLIVTALTQAAFRSAANKRPIKLAL